MQYNYDISVIMAVYNVELFLQEAVDSLIAQDMGFERIQLIMVDDGSTDTSGAICDEYAAKYPNILVVHKENGGAASARNEGLQYATGKYLNFMDSDDKYLPNAFGKMFDFFEAHEDETDVVTVPLQFFDAASGMHWQNAKFKQGTRVIDLTEEPYNAVSFINASMFPARLKDEIHFDHSLPCGEDLKMIYTLLIHKKTLGVVDGTYYMYRRRSAGEASLIATAHGKRSWYFEYFTNLQDWLVDYYTQHDDCVPMYVRYILAQETQWRFQNTPANNSNDLVARGILTGEELAQYKQTLHREVQLLDDALLMQLPFLSIEHKLFMLRFKHGAPPVCLYDPRQENLLLTYGELVLGSLQNLGLSINFIHLNRDSIVLEGMMNLLDVGMECRLEAKVGEQFYPCDWTGRDQAVCILDEPAMTTRGFHLEVPLNQGEEHLISYYLNCGGKHVALRRPQYKYTAPIGTAYRFAYYHRNGWMLTLRNHALHLCPATKELVSRREKELRRSLLRDRKNRVSLKALALRMILPVAKKLVKKPIWLISDRYSAANDNGEALFRYVAANRKDLKAYFVLHKDTADFARLKQVGPVVDAMSWKHKLLYVLCQANVSSQADEAIINPFWGHHEPYRDLYADKKLYFIQHGIILNDLSDWLRRENKDLALFVTSANPEYRSILEYPYGYDESVVKLTGLPRFDRLYNKPERQVTIMPTWRAPLVTTFNLDTGLRALKPGFEKSRYYEVYSDLLSDKRLFDAAERLGYRICFYNHPNMQAADGLIPHDPRLEEIPRTTAYRDIFGTSDLLITDYSSIAFDFGYLGKPLLYFHADKEEFYSGQHTYQAGYFDYERDGFGAVVDQKDVLVDRIIAYMENGCKMEPEYLARTEGFYAFRDQNNCQRVCDEIAQLTQLKD